MIVLPARYSDRWYVSRHPKRRGTLRKVRTCKRREMSRALRFGHHDARSLGLSW
jgi:hypothetical protein